VLSLVEDFVLTQAWIQIVLRITFQHMALGRGKGPYECLEQQRHNDPIYTHVIMKAYGGGGGKKKFPGIKKANKKNISVLILNITVRIITYSIRYGPGSMLPKFSTVR